MARSSTRSDYIFDVINIQKPKLKKNIGIIHCFVFTMSILHREFNDMFEF